MPFRQVVTYSNIRSQIGGIIKTKVEPADDHLSHSGKNLKTHVNTPPVPVPTGPGPPKNMGSPVGFAPVQLRRNRVR
jgi:hypothetical protein